MIFFYKARPGMLQRGTPAAVIDECGRYICGSWLRDGFVVVASANNVLDSIRARASDVDHDYIDLRDRTARLHASLPYTEVIHNERLRWGWPQVVERRDITWLPSFFERDLSRSMVGPDAAYEHLRVLARMRCGDDALGREIPAVVDALDFAHKTVSAAAARSERL